MHFEKTHLACPCGKSSDAYAENSDGSGKCFSCGKFFKGSSMTDDSSVTYEYLPWRGVTQSVMTKFRVRTKIDSEGKPLALGFEYPNGAIKIRDVAVKKFTSVGEMKEAHLFGKNIFNAGSSGSITIFEGELDAMSGYQMLGTPCVSVRSASSALKDCQSEYDYLSSFSKIYICFDNDEPGKKATQEVGALFGNDKVFHVKLTKYKDANDYLLHGDASEFKNAWHFAKRFVPDTVITSYNEVENILRSKRKEAICSYPFARVQDMTYGMRTGEVVLLKALEGIGKTEFIRAIEYHVLKNTDANIAILHLEEPSDRLIRGLAGYELGTPVHLPDSEVTDDETLEAYKRLTRRDERVHIYNHFGSDDPDLVLSVIRFLVVSCGCKFVFLDHITMLVTGIEQSDERQKLDYISTKLAMMAEELDFCLVFISHVNDDGQTRGSRNISKVAHLVMSLNRDKLAVSEKERNTTHLLIEKNRFGATTGPAGSLFFDRSTFVLRDEQQTDGLIPGSVHYVS